jgi:hypothetical protein
VAVTLDGARCGTHPQAAAVDVCTRCGRFVCAACDELGPDEQAYCAPCLKVLAATPPPRLAQAACVCGVLGCAGFFAAVLTPAWWLVPTPLLGLAGLMLARTARARGGRGRWLQAAWGSSWASVVALVVTVVMAVLVFRGAGEP